MPTGRTRRRDEPRTPDEVRLASYPHPYPAGWYRLSDSRALRPGEVRYVECLGRQLVLWRSASGQPNAMHAFCPHLGANLSFGCVKGECIECPFHRWQFTGDGRVALVPYSDHAPDGFLAQAFPVQEAHGQLFMYHGCDGAMRNVAATPPYPLPRIGEVDDGALVFRGAYGAGQVRMHLIEFAENAADLAHFKPVHSQVRIPWTRFRLPGFTLQHAPSLEFDRDVPWRMYFHDKATMHILGRRIEGADGNGHVSFHGPASIVHFRLDIAGRGRIVLCQTHLPVAPLIQEVNFRWFADRRLPRLLVWYVVGNWISQWRQDIQLWENKSYVDRPRLCRDDGPVLQLRQWYRQFLPEVHSGD